MNTSIVRKLSYFLSMMLVVALISCGGKKNDDEDADGGEEGGTAATNAVYPDPNGGIITGTVKLDGAAPANKAIAMDADPVCKSAHSSPAMEDHWVVGEGGVLANAFVYVKEGLGGKTYAPVGGDVTLDQHGCQYEPHVFGVMVGQKVIIKNSDQTLHNVHAHGEKNEQFNEGQPAGSPVKEKTMDKVEVMVPIKCDVHGWMNCYAGVLNHPYFAVTKADGKFEIKGLPKGDYTVTVWHETLDGKGVSVDQKVTVGDKESKTVDFAVKAQ